jgi:hypothetical protein
LDAGFYYHNDLDFVLEGLRIVDSRQKGSEVVVSGASDSEHRRHLGNSIYFLCCQKEMGRHKGDYEHEENSGSINLKETQNTPCRGCFSLGNKMLKNKLNKAILQFSLLKINRINCF